MTAQEAQYILDYIDQKIQERLGNNQFADATARLKNFAQRYMETITGQELLPQTVFRTFLEELSDMTALQSDMSYEVEKLDSGLNSLDNYISQIQILIDKINSINNEKEVIVVETHDDLLSLEDKSEEAIYITTTDDKIYLYNGTEFVEVVNNRVGNVLIYEDVNDILNDIYVTKEIDYGVYEVHITRSDLAASLDVVFTLIYPESINKFSYPILENKDGWAQPSSNKRTWTWHKYAYQSEYQPLLKPGRNVTITNNDTINADMPIDTELDTTSSNAVRNSVIASVINSLLSRLESLEQIDIPDEITIDHNFDEDSINPLENGTITKRFDDLETDVTDHDNRIIDLETQVETNTNDIADLQSQVGQNTIAISEIGEAGTTLQTQVQNIQNTINQQTLIPAETEIITVSTEQDLDELPSTDKKQDAIYITEDTNDIYVYDGEQFINKTGEQINGKIVVNTYAQLRALTTRTLAAGNYDVLYTYKYRAFDTQSHLWKIKTSQTSYTLFVPANSSQNRILNNYDGWAENYNDNGTWDWNWHTYIYEQSLTQKFQIDPDENDRIYIKPNALYELQTPLTALEIRFETSDQSVGVDTADEYIVRFTIDPNATQSNINISFNGTGYRWHDQAPTWVAGATYEMSILDKYIICAQFN